MKFIIPVILVFVLACKSGPSDQELQAQASGMVGSGISVSVKDKVVIISGTCPDEPCKTSAETSIKGIKGVKSVVNNIEIAPPPPVTAAPEITADDSLKTSVNNLLSAYKGVNATVENGVVTLTGEIKRSQLTTLMQSISELKPKKVENKLVIK